MSDVAAKHRLGLVFSGQGHGGSGVGEDVPLLRLRCDDPRGGGAPASTLGVRLQVPEVGMVDHEDAHSGDVLEEELE